MGHAQSSAASGGGSDLSSSSLNASTAFSSKASSVAQKSKENSLEWAASLEFGAALREALLDQEKLQNIARQEGLQGQVSHLTDLLLQHTLIKGDEVLELRKGVSDFWNATGAGLLEDGDTNTLGAAKPQTLARLLDQLRSFIVQTPNHGLSVRNTIQRLIIAHKLNDAVRIERELSNLNEAKERQLKDTKRDIAEAWPLRTEKEIDGISKFSDGGRDGGETKEAHISFPSSSSSSSSRSHSTNDEGQGLGFLSKKATRVPYDPSLELSMFFLSSMLACTCGGQNIKAAQMSKLLQRVNQILASCSSFFTEWSPPPLMPHKLDVNLLASSARTPTGTSRGTERASPINNILESVWISTPPHLVDDPSCCALWRVSFDVPAPVAVSEVSVSFFCAGHTSLDEYSEVSSSDVVFPLHAELRLGVREDALAPVCRWSTDDIAHKTALEQAEKSTKVLTVMFTIKDGRTASIMELALFPGSLLQRMSRSQGKGVRCPSGRIAVCHVRVKCLSAGSRLPVPRDRRKTIGDLNNWIYSLATFGTPDRSTVGSIIESQCSLANSSGCLSSILCLVQCLVAEPVDKYLSEILSSEIEASLAKLCHSIVDYAKVVLATKVTELKAALSRYHSNNSAGMKKQLQDHHSDISPYIAYCIDMALSVEKMSAARMMEEIRQSRYGSNVACIIMQVIAKAGCLYMMSRNDVLERQFFIECDPEMIERCNHILSTCVEKCKQSTMQRSQTTAEHYSSLAMWILVSLGACMRRALCSGLKRENTRLHGERTNDALLALRATLQGYLDEETLSLETRQAAAGVVDTGFEIVYLSSTQRVGIVTDLFRRYAESPFEKNSGSYFLLLHLYHRLNRVGGSVSLLPSSETTFEDMNLDDAVLPLVAWLRMLKDNNGQDGKDPGLHAELQKGSSIHLDPASMSADLLTSIFQHLSVLVGDGVVRTSEIGDRGVLEVPLLDFVNIGHNNESMSGESGSNHPRSANQNPDLITSQNPDSSTGDGGEIKTQTSQFASQFLQNSTSTNYLVGLVENVIQQIEDNQFEQANSNDVAVSSSPVTEPELTEDLQGLITAGLINRQQALEMMGQSPLPQQNLQGPPARAHSGSGIRFVQVNRHLRRRNIPLERVGENYEAKIEFRQFDTYVCPEFAVNSGKWYFELRVDSTVRYPQIGWVDPTGFDPVSRTFGTGDCKFSYAMDWTRRCYFHDKQYSWNYVTSDSYFNDFGSERGAVISCFVDLKPTGDEGFGKIYYFYNARSCPQPPAHFKLIKPGTLLLPAITLSRGEVTVRCGGKPFVDCPSEMRRSKMLILGRGALHMSSQPPTTTWRIISPQGIAYRNSPKMFDRFTLQRGPEHNDRVEALARCGERNNWLKVYIPNKEHLGFKYLPISKNGEILAEQTSAPTSNSPSNMAQSNMTQINPHVTDQRFRGDVCNSSRDSNGSSVYHLDRKGTPMREFLTYKLNGIKLKEGQFYYEVEIGHGLESGVNRWYPQLGWIDVNLFAPVDNNHGVGDDELCSWGIDGDRCMFWCNGSHKLFPSKYKWQKGSVIGCWVVLDPVNRANNKITFTFNGEPVDPPNFRGFDGFPVGSEGLAPAISFTRGNYIFRFQPPFKFPPPPDFKHVLDSSKIESGESTGNNIADSDTWSDILDKDSQVKSNTHTGWRARLKRLNVHGFDITETWKLLVKETDRHFSGTLSRYCVHSQTLMLYASVIIMDASATLASLASSYNSSFAPVGRSSKLVLLCTQLENTSVILLLPTIITRLHLLYESGFRWIARSILPFVIWSHGIFCQVMRKFVKTSKYESIYKESISNKSMSQFLELFNSIQLLAVQMCTGMIESTPMVPSELGYSNRWLDSDLFSGGISPHVRQRLQTRFDPESEISDQSHLSTNNNAYVYTVTVTTHEPLGLWLADPPEGVIQETNDICDRFAPYVLGFRRVGSNRDVGPIEEDGRVLIGHRLVSVISAHDNGQKPQSKFACVEDAYNALRLARRPVTLEFAALSTASGLSFSSRYNDLQNMVKEHGLTSEKGQEYNLKSLSQLSIKLRTLERKRQLMDTWSSSQNDEHDEYEIRRAKFCRSVATDPKSETIKWIMKNVKLQGRYSHYGKAWLGKGMYRKKIMPVYERAICAVLLKHSGLWKFAQEKTLPLPKHMHTLVMHMFNSFTILKDRLSRAETEKSHPTEEMNANSNNEKKADINYTESKPAKGKASVNNETKQTRKGTRGSKWSQLDNLVNMLDLKPLYVAEDVLDGYSNTEGTDSPRSSTDPATLLQSELSQILSRCEFLLDVIPVSVTMLGYDFSAGPDSKSDATSSLTQDDKNSSSRSGLRQRTTVREDNLGNLSMSTTLRSIQASSDNLLLDTGLIENIEESERMEAYKIRFQECISYIFDPMRDSLTSGRASAPSTLLRLMQLRTRRAYSRAFGEQAMARLLEQETHLLSNGFCQNEGIFTLLNSRAAFRGVTVNEAQAKSQSWQKGCWMNLMSSSHSQYNISPTVAQRLHHYSNGLCSSGDKAFSMAKGSFRDLFMVLVKLLKKSLQSLTAKALQTKNGKLIRPIINSCLAALAIDYEPQDAEMILEAELIPLLHDQFSIASTFDASLIMSGSVFSMNDIRTPMWTLYRFIMLLCMGGVREHHHQSSGKGGHIDDGEGKVVSNVLSAYKASERTRNNISDMKTMKAIHRSQTASLKLQRTMLAFLTNELEAAVSMSKSLETHVPPQSYIGSPQESYDRRTFEIVTFLVSMADVTALMIHFSTPIHLRTLFALFALDNVNKEVQRVVTLLLRYVLRVAGPSVANAAWKVALDSIRMGVSNEQYVSLIDMLLMKTGQRRYYSQSNFSSKSVAPDAKAMHEVECIMLLRYLFNESLAWRQLISEKFIESASATMKKWTLPYIMTDEFVAPESHTIDSTSTPEVVSLLKVLGAECDCLRIGGRVISRHSFEQTKNLADELARKSHTKETKMSEASTDSHESQNALNNVYTPILIDSDCHRVVSMPPLSTAVYLIPDQGGPAGVPVSAMSHELTICEEIVLRSDSLNDEVLNSMCQLLVHINTSLKLIRMDTGSKNIDMAECKVCHISLLVHRALNSAVVHGSSHIMHRIRLHNQSLDVPHVVDTKESKISDVAGTQTAWSSLCDIAFEASKLPEFLTTEQLESRQRTLNTLENRLQMMGPTLLIDSKGQRLRVSIEDVVSENESRKRYLLEEAAVLYHLTGNNIPFSLCFEELESYVAKMPEIISSFAIRGLISCKDLDNIVAKLHQKFLNYDAKIISSSRANLSRFDVKTGSANIRDAVSMHFLREASSTDRESTQWKYAVELSEKWGRINTNMYATPWLIYKALELHAYESTKSSVAEVERATLDWIKECSQFYKQVIDKSEKAQAELLDSGRNLWRCENCTFEDNLYEDEYCGMCNSVQPDIYSIALPESVGKSNSSRVEDWSCSICTYLNKPSDMKCLMCMSPRALDATIVDYVMPIGGIFTAQWGMDQAIPGKKISGRGHKLRQASVEDSSADAVLQSLNLDHTEIPEGMDSQSLVIDNLNSEAATNFVLSHAQYLGNSHKHEYLARESNVTRKPSKESALYGFTDLIRLQTFPWRNQMVFIPGFQSTAIVEETPSPRKLTVSDFADSSIRKEINVSDVRVPTTIFGEKILEGGGNCVITRQMQSIEKSLCSRYARDMVLRSLFGKMEQAKLEEKEKDNHSSEEKENKFYPEASSLMSSEGFESISKLLKLVAANEGVLEGKKSSTMEELVRSIQRTIEHGGKEEAESLTDLLITECIDHINGATIPADDEIQMRESLHPCYPGSDYEGRSITFDGARAMRIKFDTAFCDLGPGGVNKNGFLRFYEEDGTTLIKEFKCGGGSKATSWKSFTSISRVLRWRFKLESGASKNLHGFRFIARPLRGLGIWLNEYKVLNQHSLEWGCWLLDLMLESRSKSLKHRVRDPRIIEALQKYLMKPSSPYKDRVIKLLSRLLSDANLFCNESAINGPQDNNELNDFESWTPNPDLTPLSDLGKKLLQIVSEKQSFSILESTKAVIELVCVAFVIIRASKCPEWMYGAELRRDTPVSVPLTPRLVSCPVSPKWSDVGKQVSYCFFLVLLSVHLFAMCVSETYKGRHTKIHTRARIHLTFALNKKDYNCPEYLGH